MTPILAVPEVTHQMALLPLVWLTILRTAGTVRGAAWWWIAGAFGVSWLADTAAHLVDPWLVSTVYPVSQAALVGAVFLSRSEARTFLLALVGIAVLALLWEGTTGPGILLRTVAWGSIVGIVWPFPMGKLRAALLVAFGAGWLGWLVYMASPGWTTWGVYQGIRALSLTLFCVAAWHPAPKLRLA